MGKKHFTCKCSLRPDEHLVLITKKTEHEKELAASRSLSSPTSTPTDSNVNISQEVGLGLADSDLGLSEAMMGLNLKDSTAVADMALALALTDDGPDVTQQPSKLFTSRAEFQRTRAPHNPTSFTPIPITEAERSIQALLTNPPTAKKPNKCDRRPLEVLAELGRKLEGANKNLDIEQSFDMDDNEQTTRMRTEVNAASEVALSVEKTLQRVRDCSEKELVMKELRGLEYKISFIGASLPPETTPLRYDASYITDNPIERLDLIAQVMILLGIVCHVIIGLGTDPTNFVLQTVMLLIKLVMSLHSSKTPDGKDAYDAQQKDVLEQLPSSLYVAMQQFNIDGKTVQYAVCPSCHHTHAPQNTSSAVPSYPSTCDNSILDKSGRRICGTELLTTRNGRLRPIKPFLYASFIDYLAQILADPEIERLCDKTCDDAFASSKKPPPSHSTNVFDSTFLREFEGPVPGRLFVDRGDKMRLPFTVFFDCFNPNGTRKRGNHDSIGILSAACLLLPEEIRYKPEYLYKCIVNGPKEPSNEEINGYLRPLIDDAVVGWERGIHISPTGASPGGRDVEIAFVLSVNDLPASRKVSGSASHSSHFFCTVCSCYGIPTMYRTDFNHRDWGPRDVNELRRQAEAWRDATTLKEREEIFKKYGVRWSEMWRLPYWNPTRMLVIDTMHCILEGLVHYHCRKVLQLDAAETSNAEKPTPAFEHDWLPYEAEKVPKDYRVKSEKEYKQIFSLQSLLVLPLTGEAATIQTKEALVKRLTGKNKPALQFLCWSLGLPLTKKSEKAELAEFLSEWRYTKPLVSPSYTFRPKTIPPKALDFVQEVIAKTVTPSWINSVPKNYGYSDAGTIKADEWRILSTVYLPIALILMWGDDTSGKYGAHFFALLQHSMALFQATTLVCRYSMTSERATAFRNFLKEWVDNLYPLYPHTKFDERRPNVHVSFHIYDFLLLFGPVISWWCFPFERLIGMLQKINTNDHIDGELEATILKSSMRGANLRRWLNRPDCPQVILEFKRLFDLAFTRREFRDEDVPKPSIDREHAHYTYKGFNYSRASTHLGNSLVLFYPQSSSSATAGSIQQIEVAGNEVTFLIKRQAPLPSTKFDPFKAFPHFPAKTYSSHMLDDQPLDSIHPSRVISHCARFDFSDERSVILNLSRD